MFTLKRKAKKSRDRFIASGLIASVTGFLFMGWFDHGLYNHRVLFVYFLLLGLGVAFAKTALAEETLSE